MKFATTGTVEGQAVRPAAYYAKKTGKILLYAMAALAVMLAILAAVLRINSTGETDPFTYTNGKIIPGSIAVIEKVTIGGVDQALIIRGRDRSNPVLLYVHGGPGSPETPFSRYIKSRIENIFTVCYWEQRGAGKSYSSDIPAGSMTIERFVDDAGEVSRHLVKKFNSPRIYLMGHSWGTVVASLAAKKFPELYHAYIGVGQVADQARSEQLSYDFVLSTARRKKEADAVDELRGIGRPPYASPEEWMEKIMKERKYVARYGGALHRGNFYLMIFNSIFLCREYTVVEKFNYLQGMFFSMKLLWPQLIGLKLAKAVPELRIPVYIFQGKYDYQTVTPVAVEYYNSLKAPVKRLYIFDESAHSPNFEEPEKFQRILRQDVISR